MCELFGLSCNGEDLAIASLSILAKQYSIENDHGWGIAYFKNGKAVLKKAPEKAKTSKDFFTVAEQAKSNLLIAHVRFATVGVQCEANCHPFIQHFLNKDWVFAHNGSIPIPRHEHHPRSRGETDSEQAFNKLIDQVVRYRQKGTLQGIYPGVKEGIKSIFKRYGNNITFNFLMSDGTLFYAFNHYEENPLFYLQKVKDYGSSFLISTKRLTPRDPWKKLRADSLLVVSNGEVFVLSDPLQ